MLVPRRRDNHRRPSRWRLHLDRKFEPLVEDKAVRNQTTSRRNQARLRAKEDLELPQRWDPMRALLAAFPQPAENHVDLVRRGPFEQRPVDSDANVALAGAFRMRLGQAVAFSAMEMEAQSALGPRLRVTVAISRLSLDCRQSNMNARGVRASSLKGTPIRMPISSPR